MANCLICGKRLTANKSSDIGGGCKSKMSKSKVRWQSKVRRTAEIEKDNPVKVGKDIWKKNTETGLWESENNKPIEDIHFKEFLIRNKLVLNQKEIDENIGLDMWNKIKDNLDDLFDGKSDLTLDSEK